MNTPCVDCGQPIEYTPIAQAPGIKPRRCAPCAVIQPGYVESAVAKQELEAKTKLWGLVCPEAYQTTNEGGLTDQERLEREHPVEWPDSTREKPGLMLVGPSGHGKTRWAWRHLRTEFDAGKTVLPFTARGFEAAYREADGTHKLKSFLDECCGAGVFFLDDLGKAGWSPNTLETFYEIVEVRGSRLRPIFITTNFTSAGLAEHLRLDSAIMEPLIRRLREFCRCISV